MCHIDQYNGQGIIRDENEQDIQFFLMDLQEEIKINDQVSFEIELSARGLTATKIHLLTAEELTT